MWNIVNKMLGVILLLLAVKSNAQSVAYSSLTAAIVTDVNQLSLAETGFTDISLAAMGVNKAGIIGLETKRQGYTITESGKINMVAASLKVSGPPGYDFDISTNNTLVLQQVSESANICAYLFRDKASQYSINVTAEQVIQINADLAIGKRPVAGLYTAKDFEICLNYY